MIEPIVILAVSRKVHPFGFPKIVRKEPAFNQFVYNPESDLALLRTFPYLWDMCYWHKLKDADEVLQWIERIERWDNIAGRQHDPKGNCNNLCYSIRLLMKLGKVSKMKIAKAILDNPNVRNEDRAGEELNQHEKYIL